MREGRHALLSLVVFLASWLALVQVQAYQQVAHGVVFYVENGYTDVLTLVMSVAVFECVVCATRHVDAGSVGSRAAAQVGANTLGIYFLHMFPLSALGIFVGPRIPQDWTALSSVLLILGVYVCCFFVSWLLRMVPIVGALFKL